MPFKIAPGCSCNQRFRPLRDSPTGGFRRHPGNDAILKLFCGHKLPVGADRRRTEVFCPVAWRVKFRQHRTAGSFSLFAADPPIDIFNVRYRERMPHGPVDNGFRIMLGQDWTEHVERSDIG